MTLRVWWAWDYEVRDLGSFPTKSTYAGHNNPVPVVRLTDLREVVEGLTLLRDYTYLDAEAPELRAQNARCHKIATDLLAQLKGLQ